MLRRARHRPGPRRAPGTSSWRLVALAVALSVGVAAAPRSSDEAIARQTRELLRRATRADGPGAAVLIARGSQVVVREARGLASIELGVPLAPDHVFRIASVTKIFTAATVLKLAELGKLSLDERLSTYLPAVGEAGRATIRQLLNHTAGIPDTASGPRPGFARGEADREARVAEIGRRPLAFTPGTRWAYSNSGFILLGAVIEKVAGEPWEVALRKRLLEPLGLTRTQYGTNALLISGRVSGYTTGKERGVTANARFVSASVPDSAGALVSTADELLIWMRALAAGRAIGRDSFQQMIAPAPEVPGTSPGARYGLGVYIWRVRGATMVGHTGQIDGFASVVGHLPAQDLTVIALANDDTFDARVAGRRLAAIALGQPYPDVVAVQPSAEVLRAFEGAYGADAASARTLSVRDGRLYTQRGTRPAVPLQLSDRGTLHFVPDELSYLVPVRDAAGRVTRLDYFEGGDGPPQALPRVAGASR